MVTTTSTLFDRVAELFREASSLFEKIEELEIKVEGCEVVALRDILKAIKPVIKYIDREIAVSRSGSHDPKAKDEWHNNLRERAAVLISVGSGWRDASSNLADGTIYEKELLVLTRSGALLKIVSKGRGSGYQSEGWHYDSIVTKVDLGEAIRFYGLTEIIGGFKQVFSDAIRAIEDRKMALQKRHHIIEQLTT